MEQKDMTIDRVESGCKMGVTAIFFSNNPLPLR